NNGRAAAECRPDKLIAFTPILRQTFDGVIKSQPKTPTVVIEGEREDYGDSEQDPQHSIVVDTEYKQTEKADRQDKEFGRHDICQDGSYEKPLFAFE
ncbi:MAG: hypothetical protein DMF69_16755, partial [Acidobacteria bacterium]